MVRFINLDGENWVESEAWVNSLRVGLAQFQMNYDNKGSAIFHFYIEPDVRGIGIGSRLLDNIIGHIKKKFDIPNIRIIIGEQTSDKVIEKWLKKNNFEDIKPSDMYFAIESNKKI